MPREELREQLFGRGHASVFERVLADLATAGTIAVRERVALASHRVELSPEEDRARARSSARTATPVSRRPTRRRSPPPPALRRRSPIG